MRQVTVDVHISAPREKVFDFVGDLGGRPAWTDHYLKDYRLARPNPYGLGAAARFILKAPFANEYVELAIVEAERPRLIEEAGGVTHVELTTYSEPAKLIDRFRQTGAAGWIKRNSRMALERLRLVFEEPPDRPPARVTVAGYEPAKAARFGA